MINRSLFRIIVIMALPLLARGQEYSYTRYNIEQGLAGSTVFCMLQDKQGFMWFGTETGVSRFDGTHFRNFTTADGLPDNQVLEMFEDSKGRIWMAPFNKSVCYYYKGKIYNQRNDPVLKKINPSGHAIHFSEDRQGNVLILQHVRLHLVKTDGNVVAFNSAPGQPAGLFIAADTLAGGRIHVLEKNKLYAVNNDRLELADSLDLPYFNYRYASIRKGLVVWRYTTGIATRSWQGEKRFNEWLGGMHKFSVLGNNTISVNSQEGALVIDMNTLQTRRYLPDESVSAVYRDNEGNLWFCTLGHGVFMLNSDFIYNLELRDLRNTRIGVYALAKYKDGWLAGGDMTALFYISNNKAKLAFEYLGGFPEHITAVLVMDDGSVITGTDSRTFDLGRNMQIKRTMMGTTVKALHRNGNELLAATGRNVVRMDFDKFIVTDTLWHERSTTVYKKNDTVYIGTLDGMFVMAPNGHTMDIGQQFPEFRNRIMDIKEDQNGLLWIATYSGLFAYKDRRIIHSITESKGLVSNFCRTLHIFDSELWVGTDKGLQKIDLSNAEPAIGYSLSHELSSNIINAILADSSTLIVATPVGVNIIDKKNISIRSRCDLRMDNIEVSGSRMQWEGTALHLPTRDNNIRFEFAGISYRSGGDIRYRYRLVGLDTNWRQTRENFLSYPTLPGGGYRLEIEAINKFGIKSQMLTIPFSIERRLLEKGWFQALMLAAAAVLVWLILTWRIKVIRRQEAEKNNVRKRIADLEQLALKSQMNPHFIFNSLNSIQHYVLDKDIEGVNKFITGFSRLIRQTLDISSRHEISLAEEISYLLTYLQLEKMRFENKFTFEVTADASVNVDDCFIPPMILQPFVENCVRHGIRYRRDDKGRISISFRKQDNFLECVIEDNGVGRKLAGSYKSSNPIEYQSKGISLTTDRIELINQNSERPISINIFDLEDGQGESRGTKVVLSFPL